MPNRHNFVCKFCGLEIRTNYKHEKEECNSFCEENMRKILPKKKVLDYLEWENRPVAVIRVDEKNVLPIPLQIPHLCVMQQI